MNTTPTPGELATMLRNCADGSPLDMAAVELLISHGMWLRRRDFVKNLVDVLAAEDLPNPDRPVASVAWYKVPRALERGQLPCTGSEAAILRTAASLAGDQPVALGQNLTSLDRTNLGLVVTAIATARSTGAVDIRKTQGKVAITLQVD